MRGEAERGRSTGSQRPGVRWVRQLIPRASARSSRTKAIPDVHQVVLPWAPMPSSGRRGRPDSFGYEPFMCAWEHPHTKPAGHQSGPKSGPKGGPKGARTPRREA
jgi:hypothetical protein